ncbi:MULTISPECIES: tyrosine-type recombinase/integrase [Bacillus]|uniref:tyrosine-type recombinase/integrase n=1 Tax=Bacillus TaxID=1386 RepID=UPI0002F1B49C|nr:MULTISPECIES: tyrosine-type recombinase/integrase [Bacillus]
MLNTEELITQFIVDYGKKLAQNTLRGYKTALEQLFEFTGKSFGDISKSDIRNWLLSLAEKGCKPSTINYKLKAMRLFYKYCVEEEYLINYPVVNIPDSKVEEKLPYYLSYEQLSSLRAICKEDLRFRAVVEVLYSTGIRVSELANMKLEEINWTERMILIPEGKGKKARFVYFTRTCEEHLKAYLRTRRDNLPFVFINRLETTTIGTKSVVYGFINYRKELDFYVSPHTLRHTFAAHLVMKGMPVVSIQTLLGHDDPRTTQTYSRLFGQAQKEMYDQWH